MALKTIIASKTSGCFARTVTAKRKPSVDGIRRRGNGMPWVPRFNWPEIQRYHEQGHSVRECCDTFGFSIGGWYKARAKGRVRTICDPKYQKRYDWSEVQAYYDQGHSIRDCCKKFGFWAGSWAKATRRGDVKARPVRIELAKLLETSRSRSAIKRRLLRDGILKNECSRCGISEWQEKPICIQIDHINGINDDYRIENLRMLCANCHSLTPTHGRRNVGRKNRSEGISFLLAA